MISFSPSPLSEPNELNFYSHPTSSSNKVGLVITVSSPFFTPCFSWAEWEIELPPLSIENRVGISAPLLLELSQWGSAGS